MIGLHRVNTVRNRNRIAEAGCKTVLVEKILAACSSVGRYVGTGSNQLAVRNVYKSLSFIVRLLDTPGVEVPSI